MQSVKRIFCSVLIIAFASSGYTSSSKSSANAEQDLCSTDGLMRLVPQLKNADGKFAIPNPKTDLPNFLIVHQALTNIIEMSLAKANIKGNPYQVANSKQVALTFPLHWRSAEIGVMTDGKTVSFPNVGGFASYGGESFLDGITPVAGTQGVFYQVNKPDSTTPALVYSQPTALACVNRLVLAGANTAGTWLPPSYALGTKDGSAFLIVDKCVDLGIAVTKNKVKQLAPNGELFTAIQWADSSDLAHMRTTDKAHSH